MINIKVLKKKFNKKNKEIAEYCGVTINTVDRWTAGIKKPSKMSEILLEHFFILCECEKNMQGDNDSPCKPSDCKLCKAYHCKI